MPHCNSVRWSNSAQGSVSGLCLKFLAGLVASAALGWSSIARAQVDFETARLEDAPVEVFAFADFNGDGLPDIAAAVSSSVVEIRLHDGGDRFIPVATVSTGSFDTTNILTGDFDEDGAI